MIDEGSKELELSFAYRPRPRERVLRFVLKHPTPFYLGTLALMTALVVVLLAFAAYASGAGVGMLVALVLLSLVPASDLAVSVLNWDVTHLLAPRLLPSMESEDGVPADALTMVVVPTLLTSPEGVRELVEKLEVHYLAIRTKIFTSRCSGISATPGRKRLKKTRRCWGWPLTASKS